MGIDFALARFFDKCAEKAGLRGPMLALGSLEIQEDAESIAAYARTHNYRTVVDRKSVPAFFRERYNIDRYTSCDVNGLADIFVDLGKPLGPHLRGQFATVLNGGTLEHVFDLRQAMENIHDATRVGGLMLHTCPVTWFNHGFVNHNPLLFHLAAKVNEYDVVAEGYYFNTAAFQGQAKPFVTLVGDEYAPAPEWPLNDGAFAGAALPANCMYLVALRKTSDAPFAVPSQVSHGAVAVPEMLSSADRPSHVISRREHRYGNGHAKIHRVTIRNSESVATTTLRPLERCQIELEVEAYAPRVDVVTGFLIRSATGVELFGMDSLQIPVPQITRMSKGERTTAYATFTNVLAPGRYCLTATLAQPDRTKLDVRFDTLEFDVMGTADPCALVNLEMVFCEPEDGKMAGASSEQIS